ncbi:hypothetical protein BDV35DRAFT_356938 [Aspergillus flavus]|uniref:Uncharacterized protein n=1 Tax=Aspergillus flavus TaxID=5059 RepID=A0A5N6GSZ7_ASPFL|nr:hypothetical protein BDV35DRAFT_356938 [Aspergillus flavus]
MYKRMYEEVMVLVACWYPIHSSFRSGLGILKICALSVSLTALCHQKKGGIRPTTSKEDETMQIVFARRINSPDGMGSPGYCPNEFRSLDSNSTWQTLRHVPTIPVDRLVWTIHGSISVFGTLFPLSLCMHGYCISLFLASIFGLYWSDLWSHNPQQSSRRG